jgi:hypothetical protein
MVLPAFVPRIIFDVSSLPVFPSLRWPSTIEMRYADVRTVFQVARRVFFRERDDTHVSTLVCSMGMGHPSRVPILHSDSLTELY